MKKVLLTAFAAMAMFAMTACNNQPAEATEDTTAAVAEQCDHHCMDTTAHEGCCEEMAAVEGQACEHKCQKAEGQECEHKCEKACDHKCQKAEGKECCKKACDKKCEKAEGKECEHKCQK